MNCEHCQTEHDGTYGSGRFCSSHCARGFSTAAKREAINEKVSQSMKGKMPTGFAAMHSDEARAKANASIRKRARDKRAAAQGDAMEHFLTKD